MNWAEQQKLIDARKKKKKKTHEEVCQMIIDMGITPVEKPKKLSHDQRVWEDIYERARKLRERRKK
jgi:hypothetical protein